MAPPKKKRKKVASLDKKKAKAGWWFIMPFLFGFITVYLPIVFRSIIYSISDKANANGKIIGFENYVHILTQDENFTKTLTGGIQQLIFDIPAIVIFSLFMAVLLNQKVLGRAVFRAIFFVPVILGTGLIDELDNLANPMLDSMSQNQGAEDGGTGTSATEIISTYDLARLFEGMKVGTELVKYVTDLVNNIYGIINRSGVQLLIFLAGLQSISPAIYESCSIDGATTWETFWKITFPMISPMILVNTVYTVIDAFTSQSNSVMQLILKTKEQPIAASMAWVYFLLVIVIIGAVTAFVSTFVFYQRRD
jgi:ABC-type sugar transport system permease subunit